MSLRSVSKKNHTTTRSSTDMTPFHHGGSSIYTSVIALCIVCEFNYLGVVFNYNGRFIKHSRMVTCKALNSFNVLKSNTRQVLLSPKIVCQLFDVFVGSVLMYGTEIWGFTKETSIEKVHLKFCKKLLSVKLSAFNATTWEVSSLYYLNILGYLKIGIKYDIAITVFYELFIMFSTLHVKMIMV